MKNIMLEKEIAKKYGDVSFVHTYSGEILGVWLNKLFHKVIIRDGKVYLERNINFRNQSGETGTDET